MTDDKLNTLLRDLVSPLDCGVLLTSGRTVFHLEASLQDTQVELQDMAVPKRTAAVPFPDRRSLRWLQSRA